MQRLEPPDRPDPADLCARARMQFSLRVDGKLSEFEGALLDKHLELCAGCRAFAKGVAELTTALRAAPLEVPDFSVRVPHRRTAGWVNGFRAVSTAAAVALTGLVGLHLSAGLSSRTELPARTDVTAARKLMGLKERQLADLAADRSPPCIAAGLQAAEGLTPGSPSQPALAGVTGPTDSTHMTSEGRCMPS